MGDYNLPGIDWSSYASSAAISLTENTPSTITVLNIAKFVLESFDGLGLRQLNFIKNIFGNVLDLCFSSLEEVKLVLADEVLSKIDIAHPVFNIDLRLPVCDTE